MISDYAALKMAKVLEMTPDGCNMHGWSKTVMEGFGFLGPSHGGNLDDPFPYLVAMFAQVKSFSKNRR